MLDDWRRTQVVGIRGSDDGIKWGGESPYLSANIGSVHVEAFESAADERKQRVFDVVATADMTSSVQDTLMFNLFAPVPAKLRFRLVSRRLVILREQVEDVTITLARRQYFVTTRFAGLSRAEAGKIHYVSASWVFD